MSEIRKVREAKVKFDLVVADSLPEYYADGVTTAIIGIPICKILFHSITSFPTDEQREEGIEGRRASFQVAMPLPALIDFAQNILNSVEANREQMNAGFDQIQAQLNASLDDKSTSTAKVQAINKKKR